MSKFPTVKSEKLIKVLLRIGFLKHHQVGSHAQFKHPDGRRITVPVHRGKEIPGGTLQAIIRDIGISREDFIKLLRG